MFSNPQTQNGAGNDGAPILVSLAASVNGLLGYLEPEAGERHQQAVSERREDVRSGNPLSGYVAAFFCAFCRDALSPSSPSSTPKQAHLMYFPSNMPALHRTTSVNSALGGGTPGPGPGIVGVVTDGTCAADDGCAEGTADDVRAGAGRPLLAPEALPSIGVPPAAVLEDEVGRRP